MDNRQTEPHSRPLNQRNNNNKNKQTKTMDKKWSEAADIRKEE